MYSLFLIILYIDLLLPKDAEIIWQGKPWFLPADLPSKQALVVISLQEELTRGKISAYREVIKLYTELLKIKNGGIKIGVLSDLSFKQLMELIVFVSKEILGGITTEDEDIEKKTLTEMEKNKEI